MAIREDPKKRKKATTSDRDRTTKKRSSVWIGEIGDGRVRVGSEVGITLPIEDTTAHIRFSFWHERIAKSDSQEELKRTVAQIDEFNEAELDRRVRKYIRLIKRIAQEEEDDDRSHGTKRRTARRR